MNYRSWFCNRQWYATGQLHDLHQQHASYCLILLHGELMSCNLADADYLCISGCCIWFTVIQCFCVTASRGFVLSVLFLHCFLLTDVCVGSPISTEHNTWCVWDTPVLLEEYLGNRFLLTLNVQVAAFSDFQFCVSLSTSIIRICSHSIFPYRNTARISSRAQ